MPKIRVAIAGTVGKSVLIDTDAGTQALAAVNALRAQIAAISTSGSTTLAHSALQGLQIGDDHPQYTMWADAENITGLWNFATIPTIQGETLAEYIEDVVGGDFFDFLQDTPSIKWAYFDSIEELEANVDQGWAPVWTNTHTWTDNDEVRLGTGGDLRFYHDGTDSFIRNDTGILKLNYGASSGIWLNASGAVGFGGANYGTSGYLLQSNGSSAVPTWVVAPASGGGSANIQVFSADGTWTMPAGAKVVTIICVGAGGSGGTGRRAASTGTRGGGAGGGAGGTSVITLDASDITSPVAVTVGVGGTSVARNLVDTTNGTAGNPGGSSTFGAYLTAGGGGGGAAGTTSGNPTQGTSGAGNFSTGTGVAGSATTAAGLMGAGPGGDGGAIASGSNGNPGDDGSTGPIFANPAIAGGAGGAGGSGVSNAGAPGNASSNYYGGSGGGGGSGRNGTGGLGGNGGDGGYPGGGGGGGGGTTNAATDNGTGQSGAGANGQVVVITYF